MSRVIQSHIGLIKVITTTVTQSTLDQILICGSFDEYILSTSPAKLMSDFGCKLKKGNIIDYIY